MSQPTTPPTLPPPIVLYQIGTAHYLSQALYVAAKLGIADHLEGAPRSADELARAVGAHAPSLRRVMRLLVTAEVFSEDDEGRFGLTPLGACLRSGPGSFRAMVQLFAGPAQWKTWGDLIGSVRTGEPAFERVFGMGAFEYFASHPDEAAVFDEAMSSFTATSARALASAWDFSSVRTMIDVGGGDGALAVGVLEAHPHLAATVLDLPRVARAAEARLTSASPSVAARAAFVAGDFFESVPSGLDVYVLKHVIHDWDDERATKILSNVRRAMGPSAKVLLFEGVYPARVDAAARGAAANDCNMLVATGGRQRSEQEFRALYAASGLRLTRILPTAAPSLVIEGEPA